MRWLLTYQAQSARRPDSAPLLSGLAQLLSGNARRRPPHFRIDVHPGCATAVSELDIARRAPRMAPSPTHLYQLDPRSRFQRKWCSQPACRRAGTSAGRRCQRVVARRPRLSPRVARHPARTDSTACTHHGRLSRDHRRGNESHSCVPVRPARGSADAPSGCFGRAGVHPANRMRITSGSAPPRRSMRRKCFAYRRPWHALKRNGGRTRLGRVPGVAESADEVTLQTGAGCELRYHDGSAFHPQPHPNPSRAGCRAARQLPACGTVRCAGAPGWRASAATGACAGASGGWPRCFILIARYVGKPVPAGIRCPRMTFSFRPTR